MTYPFAIKTPQRTATFTEPAGWGKKRIELYNQTDISAIEEWMAHAHSMFDNDFYRAKQALFVARVRERKGGYALLTRDRIRKSKRGTDDKGRLHVLYIPQEGTEFEKKKYVWEPKPGFVVPTGDDVIKTKDGKVIWMPYQDGTAIPRETLPFDNRKEAERRLEAKGIPIEQLSGFYRPDNYDLHEAEGGSLVSCVFVPGSGGGGRFVVDADWLPSGDGLDWLASRPAYKGPQVLVEVEKFLK